MLPPTFDDILAAREFIAPYLPKTPLVRVEKLSELLDCDYYAKLENLQPVGAFKVRGGVNLVGTASREDRQAGLVSASTCTSAWPSSRSISRCQRFAAARTSESTSRSAR